MPERRPVSQTPVLKLPTPNQTIPDQTIHMNVVTRNAETLTSRVASATGRPATGRPRAGRPRTRSGSPSTVLPIPVGALFLGLLSVSCASTPEEPVPAAAPSSVAVQPGAPGEATRTLSAEERDHRSYLPHTEADVRFMQNMILHHEQAVEMSALVPDRTEREDIRLLARRIDRSQEDEIRLMERWLEKRDEELPVRDESHHHQTHHQEHADHRQHGELMAGMLSSRQMAELEASEGPEFDRLFLEFMIFHHEGALQMVEELFASPGAAQDSEIYQFASHVGADQRIEIGRMSRMLAEDR